MSDQQRDATIIVGDRFPPLLRLRRAVDFQRVFQRRVSVADHMLIVYAARNGLKITRLGLSVSRKVGNAVVRNCWKRSIREAFRRQRQRLPIGMDLVVLPRRGTQPRSGEIYDSLTILAWRLEKKMPSARWSPSTATATELSPLAPAKPERKGVDRPCQRTTRTPATASEPHRLPGTSDTGSSNAGIFDAGPGGAP